MSENSIRIAAAIAGMVVGGNAIYFMQVGRIEARVEREVTVRVQQANIARDVEHQREQWWVLQGEVAKLREKMSASHAEQ